MRLLLSLVVPVEQWAENNMALNTTVQPFIQKMLMPPDAEGAGAALAGAFKNFAGAYVAAKEGKRNQQAKKATNPQSYDEAVDGVSNPPSKPGRFENFARAYLGAQGEVAMGANPALRPQVDLLNQRVHEGDLEERTLNAITSQNPIQVAEQAGNLKPSEIPQWLQKNAALRAIPWGQKIWDGVASTYGDSEQAKISSAKAQAMGKLAIKYPSLNISNPDDLSKMRKNESVEVLYDRAKNQGKLLNQLPDDWFFDDGTINEQKAVPGIGGLPRSETLQSLEERGEDRARSQMAIVEARLQAQSDMLEFKLQHGGGYTPGALEKDFSFIDRATGLTPDQKQKAKEVRLFLEPKAAVERPEKSKAAYVGGKIDAFMKSGPTKEVERTGISGAVFGSKKVPMTRDEAIAELESEYDRVYGGSNPVSGFRKGDRVKQGGVTYEFDGVKMVPVP